MFPDASTVRRAGQHDYHEPRSPPPCPPPHTFCCSGRLCYFLEFSSCQGACFRAPLRVVCGVAQETFSKVPSASSPISGKKIREGENCDGRIKDGSASNSSLHSFSPFSQPSLTLPREVRRLRRVSPAIPLNVLPEPCLHPRPRALAFRPRSASCST